MSVTLGISLTSLALAIATFFIARHKDTKTDAKEEAYKQGTLDEKLNNISKQLTAINEKLDKYDESLETFKEKLENEMETLKEKLENDVDSKIEKAIDSHIAIYHKE